MLTHGYRREVRNAQALIENYKATVSTSLYGDRDFVVRQSMPIAGPWAYSFGRLFMPIRTIEIKNAKLGDEAWETMGKLDDPMILVLEDCQITTSGPTFSRMPRLWRIHLRRTNVTAAQMGEIAQLDNLQDLRFDGCNDEPFRWLDQLCFVSRVRKIYFNHYVISHAQLQTLTDGMWYRIDLSNSHIDMGRLDELPPNNQYTQYMSVLKPHLAESMRREDLPRFCAHDYGLANTNVGDQFVAKMLFQDNYYDLDLSGTNISDDTLELLGTVSHPVRRLAFNETNVTDDGLRHLFKMEIEEDIELFGTQVTRRSLDDLETLGSGKCPSYDKLKAAIEAHLFTSTLKQTGQQVPGGK